MNIEIEEEEDCHLSLPHLLREKNGIVSQRGWMNKHGKRGARVASPQTHRTRMEQRREKGNDDGEGIPVNFAHAETSRGD